MARLSFLGIAATTLVMGTTILAQSIQLTLPTNPPATLSETVSRTFTMDLPPLSNDIPSTTSVTTCPTVVSTTEICSECVTIACVAPLTITAPCGCETPVVTIYRSHPCGNGCAGLEGCQTQSVVVLPTDCSGSSGGAGGSSSTGSGSGTTSASATTTTGSPTETEVLSSGEFKFSYHRVVQCVAGCCCFVDAFISLLENPYCSKQAAKWRLISALKAGSSRTESESSVETTIATVTTADTNTLSAPVSTLPPTSTASTAAAARLAPFRLW